MSISQQGTIVSYIITSNLNAGYKSYHDNFSPEITIYHDF